MSGAGPVQTEAEQDHVVVSTTVNYLDNYIEAIDALRDEAVLIFREDEVMSKVVGPATVGMCVSRIKGQALNRLDLEGSDEFRLGIECDEILDCLSGVSSTSELRLTYPVSSGGGYMVRLEIIDEDITFELPVLDPDTIPEMTDLGVISHKTRVIVGGSDFKKTIDHAGKVTDKDNPPVMLETFDNTFQVRTNDKVDGSFTKQFHQSGPSEDEKLGEHSTEIGLTYLKSIKKQVGRGEKLTVHIEDSQPVRLDVNLDEEGDAQVVYVIAPRVAED